MRRILILVHLLIASFIAPAFLLVAISGGLYLLGIKGDVVSTPVSFAESARLDFESATLETDVRALLNKTGIAHEFEYLRNRGNLIQTRPTSRRHIEFVKTEQGVSASWMQPDLQMSMIELHKGHGPLAFKTYQKLVAVALLGSVLSGLWMGLASPMLRRKTLLVGASGLLVFMWLALT